MSEWENDIGYNNVTFCNLIYTGRSGADLVKEILVYGIKHEE